MDTNNHTKSTRPIRREMRALLVLGLPLIGSQVAQFAVHTTETILMGWYSILALAQVAIGAQVFFLAFIIGGGFSWAVLPLVATAVEQGDDTTARRITRMGLWLSTGAALVSFVPMWFSAPLLIYIGQDPEVAAGAQTYLRICGVGIFPSLWALVLRSHLSALEHTGVVLAVAVTVLIFNALLSIVLIFGYFGFPELGLVGAGIAALVVQFLTFFGFVAYLQIYLPEQALFVRIWRADWAIIQKVTRLALPISGTALAESGLFAASMFMMGALGVIEAGAHNVVLQLAALTFMVHLGLSNAATVRVGQAYARNDRAALHRTALTGMGLSSMIAVAVIAVFLLAPDALVTVFLNKKIENGTAVAQLAVWLLVLAAAFQFVDAAQVMALSVLRGMQDTKVPMICATISYWIIGLPIGYVLGFQLGWRETGIWMGLIFGLALTAVLLWARYIHMIRRWG